MSRLSCWIFLATVAVPGSALALQQDGIIGDDDLGVFVNLDVSYTRDSNVFRLPNNEVDDTVMKVTPSVTAQGRLGGTKLRLGYTGDYGKFNDLKNDDYDDHSFVFDVDFASFSTHGVTPWVNYTMGHDTRGSGGSEGDALSVSRPDEYKLWDYGAAFEFGRTTKFGLSLSAGKSDKEYTNNSLFTSDRDHSRTSTRGTLNYNVSPSTKLYFGVQRADIEYDQIPTVVGVDFSLESLDSEQLSKFVGVSWDITGRTTGFIDIGRQDKDFVSNGRGDLDRVNHWNLGVTWSPRTYSTVSLSSRKDFDETNGQGDAIETQGYDISWRHQWNDRVSSSLGYSYTRDEFDPTPRRDKTTSVNFSLDYQLRRWFDIRLAGRSSDRSSNEADIDYDGNQFTLSLRFGL